jgi:hypothetical protein
VSLALEQRFRSGAAKDWIRSSVDAPLVEATAKRIRDGGRRVVYVGCPGPDLLDLDNWRGWIDYAISSEKDAVSLRELKGNARALGWEGKFEATRMTLGELIAQSTDEAREIFERAPEWPSVLNYDVYANPVRGNLARFDRHDGLWSDLSSFLRQSGDAVPEVLMLITANLRGKGQFYDQALRAIFKELGDDGMPTPDPVQQAFLGAGMGKKVQICLPYWLSRGGATLEGFQIEVLASLDYPGTGVGNRKSMFHLALLLTRVDEEAAMPGTPLRRLLNFPHRSATPVDDDYQLVADGSPVIPAT